MMCGRREVGAEVMVTVILPYHRLT
jgi:hypothetical protein